MYSDGTYFFIIRGVVMDKYRYLFYSIDFFKYIIYSCNKNISKDLNQFIVNQINLLTRMAASQKK